MWEVEGGGANRIIGGGGGAQAIFKIIGGLTPAGPRPLLLRLCVLFLILICELVHLLYYAYFVYIHYFYSSVK